MIAIENISKTYDGITYALEKVNLALEEGRIMSLLGHNGAGKSTLLKILATILSPSAGEVYYNGVCYSTATIDELREIKKTLGFLGESPYLFDKLTPYEYLFYIGQMYGIDDEDYLKERIEYLVEIFELESANKKFLEAYSSGMKKRTALAGVFLSKPQLILLDEPTNNLDPVGIKFLKEFLVKIKEEGSSIIFATHQLEIAEKLSDVITIIDTGSIIFSGTMEQIKAKAKLIDGEKTLENLYKILIEKKNKSESRVPQHLFTLSNRGN